MIEYAGKKLNKVDAVKGELTALEIFVAILPYSQDSMHLYRSMYE